jgi:hypothetical protein
MQEYKSEIEALLNYELQELKNPTDIKNNPVIKTIDTILKINIHSIQAHVVVMDHFNSLMALQDHQSIKKLILCFKKAMILMWEEEYEFINLDKKCSSYGDLNKVVSELFSDIICESLNLGDVKDVRYTFEAVTTGTHKKFLKEFIESNDWLKMVVLTNIVGYRLLPNRFEK